MLESVVVYVPDSWLRPEWWEVVLTAVIAVAIALPLFIAAFVLKKMRERVGHRFPLSSWALLPLWCWMVLVTTIRAVIDLLGITAAWVDFNFFAKWR